MKYETRKDKDRERLVARYVAKKWGGEVFEGDEYARLDFTLVRDGKVIAMIEIKIRETIYPTIWFPLSKALIATTYQNFGIPTYFFVGKKDKKPVFIDIGAHLPESIVWDGAADRDKKEALLCYRLADFSEL